MRRFALLVAVAGALPFASAYAQKPEMGQKIDVGRSCAPNVALHLVGAFAKLRVVGWAQDSVAIKGFAGKGQKFDFYGGTPGTRMSGAKLSLDSPEPVKGGSFGTLEMYVPIGARVWVKGGTASIEASGMTGELELYVVGGTVQVNGNLHMLKVEAMDANVTVEGNPDYVRLNTAAGDIVMRGSSPDAGFESVSGNIRVSDGTFERVQFDNVDGGVTFVGELGRVSSMSVDTHGGPIDLTFTGKPSLRVDAFSLTGVIENFLTKAQPSAGKDGRGQGLVFEVGNGSGRVEVRTFKGSIRLSRK